MLMLPLVLRSIAGLQRFTFHFSRVADFEDFCPLKLCHAITRHGKTLMELNISYPGVEWFDVSEAFGRRLASFPRLRRLAIPDSFLFPYSNDQTECSYRERLPASLQDLQLQCAFSFDDWEDDDFAYADERHMRIKRLRRLAGPMEEQLPELRRVVWWDQEDRFGEEDLWARGFEQQLAELRTYLRRRIGVSFELMSFLEWQDTPFGKVEGNEFD